MEFEKKIDEGHSYADWIVGNKYKYSIFGKYSKCGIEEDDFYKILSEMVLLLKTKGLTMRQAQIVLDGCKEAILDTVNMD